MHISHTTITAIRKIVLPLLFGLLLIGIWSALIEIFQISEVYLPTIGAILDSAIEQNDFLINYSQNSLIDMMIAFVGSSALGFALALIVYLIPLFRKAVYPIILAFEVIPKITLAPLFIIWFGPGEGFRILFAVYLSFFSVFMATTTGLASASLTQVNLGRSLRASQLQVLLHIRLPNAMPSIVSGLKIAATMSVIGVIAGEFLAGNSGLGYIVMFASYNMESPLMFAALIYLSLLGVGIYLLAVLAEKATNMFFGDIAGH